MPVRLAVSFTLSRLGRHSGKYEQCRRYDCALKKCNYVAAQLSVLLRVTSKYRVGKLTSLFLQFGTASTIEERTLVAMIQLQPCAYVRSSSNIADMCL